MRLTLLAADEPQRAAWRDLFADGLGGFLSWLNLCGWTYNPRTAAKHHPFTTWPVQARAAEAVWTAIDDGRDVLIDKSRDMGATWLNVAVLLWWWLFVADIPLLMVSRKEDYVDARGNPDTLFWKADYLLRQMPAWLAPPLQRRHGHLGNLANGSTLDGESTNGDVGRGGRRKAILLDEFAAVDNGREILTATADTAPCRIFNSTPKGRGNAFADVRFSGKVPVITLHWREHPEKGRDAEEVILDGRAKWTSPWYRRECARRTSRKEIAQELDIDYLASGDAFFDLDVCQRLRAGGQLRKPDAAGELTYAASEDRPGGAVQLGDVRFEPDVTGGRLALWCPLSGADGPPRPPQNFRYVAFADVAHGTGASNSVIKVLAVDTAEEVGSFVCPDTPPHELARCAVALCRFFGGRNGLPMLGWEANGPGGIFGLEVQRLGYPYLLKTIDLDTEHHPEDARVGWFSSRRNKETLLGSLRRCLARGEVTFHDQAFVAEAEQYVYLPEGGIGPSSLSAEAGGARAAHGDRVIAAAGAVLCLTEQPRTPAPARSAAADSFLARRRWAHRKRMP